MKRESKYNLSDDDEGEINVHNMLSEKDDFDEEVPLDDGSDEEGTVIMSLLLEYSPFLSSFSMMAAMRKVHDPHSCGDQI